MNCVLPNVGYSIVITLISIEELLKQNNPSRDDYQQTISDHITKKVDIKLFENKQYLTRGI